VSVESKVISNQSSVRVLRQFGERKVPTRDMVAKIEMDLVSDPTCLEQLKFV
jgi:hypothetical protein